MPTDRQLFEKLGKLLDAAAKEAAGHSDEYRNYCYKQIWSTFWKIEKQIKTGRGDYYDPDGTYEEDMRAVYGAYQNQLWLMDVMDEIDEPDEPDGKDSE